MIRGLYPAEISDPCGLFSIFVFGGFFGTFFAEILLEVNGQQVLVDARPSDSIALALRTNADIFVDEDVMQTGQGWSAKEPRKTEKEKAEELRKFLENMDPSDFGKFGI